MKKKYESIKEYRKELAYAQLENYNLRKKTKENGLIKRMVNHELRGSMGTISGMTNLLEEELYNSDEGRKEFCDIIYKEIDKILNISSILSMDGTSKNELRKKYGKFSIEEIASNNAYTRNSNLIGEEIELDLKYNKIHQQEIAIYSNKGVIEAIWKTLTENAANFAPKHTKIKQGIRFDEKGNLEIIMENQHENNIPKRKFGGLGEGIGLKFSKEMIKKLNGNVEIYNTSIMDKTYHRCDKYGEIIKKNENADNKEYKTFSVKIIIPKSEILGPGIKEE